MNPRIFAALVLVAGMFVAAAIGYGWGDGDLWWQRQLGEAVLRTGALPLTLGTATFSAPDARWIPHEWIFATAWALAIRLGGDLWFRLGCAGLAFLTVLVEAARSRGGSSRARMIMLVLVAYAVTPSFGLRAQVLGWPFLALLMLALESGPRRAWFAVPISVVWFNLHASALVVPCIILCDGLGRTLESRRVSTLAGAIGLAGACALASLATPFGVALPRFAFAWSTNPATALIAEWSPAAPDKILILAGVVLIALLLVAGELRGARLTWPQRLVAAALFVATMLHIRNLALFSIVAGPWTVNALTALLSRETWRGGSAWRRDGGLAALAAAGALALVLLRVRTPVAAGELAPAVAQLTALHVPLRVACEDFSWCSRFAADGRVQVLLDGRTDAYPATVFADYRRMNNGDPLPVFARWRIDAAVVHAHGALAHALRAGGWKRLRSAEPQVYLRPPADGARFR